VSHILLVLMHKSLHDVIKEQGLLSKRSRLPSDYQLGANLTWAIEVEKTHIDRLLALFKSVCDNILLIVSVRGNAFGTVGKKTTKDNSRRNTSVVAGCSSLIFSSINMVTDTKLPPEAFRPVHRMFYVPYSCHDPISIIGHPAFMSVIISVLSESETSSADLAKVSADFKLLIGDNNHAITLKVQTSPKELANHLIEMINSELEFKYLKLISFENYQDGEGNPLNVKVEVKGGSSVNGCQRRTAVNSNENSSENTGLRGERSVENSGVSKGDVLALTVGDEMSSKQTHTHLLQCIYGADDGIFRWGIVSTEYSVRNRLTAESIEFEIENERQKRFKRDDVSRDERTRSAHLAATNVSNRTVEQGQGSVQGHCVDFQTIQKGERRQGNARDRTISSSNSSSSSSDKSNINSDSDSYDVSSSLHYQHLDQIMQENQNVPNNVSENSSSGPSSGPSSFTPASRAYYKMSEIKEFYFPLWGWIWPGDDVDGDCSVRDDDCDDTNCTSGDRESAPPQNGEFDGNKISETIQTKSQLKSRKWRKSRVSIGCCAVDIGSSPGGWTQCLAAHCVYVISVDPGESKIKTTMLC
jgi:FtsJ-like methyltransferase